DRYRRRIRAQHHPPRARPEDRRSGRGPQGRASNGRSRRSARRRLHRSSSEPLGDSCTLAFVSRPTLIVVSGPAGTGKTTLAHELARAIGCPAICRDEIKEGMVHAAGSFRAAPGDPLTVRTLRVFFDVVYLLVSAGVTVVAEAAFQDTVWAPN